jgi:hypothetical protein
MVEMSLNKCFVADRHQRLKLANLHKFFLGFHPQGRPATITKMEKKYGLTSKMREKNHSWHGSKHNVCDSTETKCHLNQCPAAEAN